MQRLGRSTCEVCRGTGVCTAPLFSQMHDKQHIWSLTPCQPPTPHPTWASNPVAVIIMPRTSWQGRSSKQKGGEDPASLVQEIQGGGGTNRLHEHFVGTHAEEGHLSRVRGRNELETQPSNTPGCGHLLNDGIFILLGGALEVRLAEHFLPT